MAINVACEASNCQLYDRNEYVLPVDTSAQLCTKPLYPECQDEIGMYRRVERDISILFTS